MARPPLLTDVELASALTELPGWEYDAGKRRISYTFRFKDYAAALACVTHVSMLAERLNHHPDVRFGWGYASFSLMTHDMGGITELDITLAKRINGIML